MNDSPIIRKCSRSPDITEDIKILHEYPISEMSAIDTSSSLAVSLRCFLHRLLGHLFPSLPQLAQGTIQDEGNLRKKHVACPALAAILHVPFEICTLGSTILYSKTIL